MKQLLVLFMALALAMPTKAQWDRWNTSYAISGVLSIASQSIASAERKKAMEINAKQKVEFQQSFQEAMDEAKAFEAVENWEEALENYEEAAKLNVKYGYTDQHSLSRKITSLYVKGEREDDGPSILNNDKTILPDYSGYRYVRENPVYVNKKKEAMAGIVRVACSDKETRLELELEATHPNYTACIKGTAYIKGDKGDKLELTGVQNITVAPTLTHIPWPYQKLRFALIFPALPVDATEFDFIVPSFGWKYKDIKCR